MLSKEIIREVKKMLLYILAMDVVMIVFFGIFGHFNIPVVLGALLGGFVAFINFLLLAFAVEKSVNGNNNAKGVMASSYMIRLLFIGVVVVFAIKSPYVNYLAMIIPLIFPRIIIMFVNLFKKRAE